MYTYPYTMYITCMHIHLQCTLHTLTVSMIHEQQEQLSNSILFPLTNSSLLSFSSSSVTKPGNKRIHT